MTDQNAKSGSTKLAQILSEMNKAGGFPISILTDRNGFPIASAASPNQDPETQSAVVALIQKTAAQAQDQLGMAQTDEISLYAKDGQRLVCRPVSTTDHDLILAVVVPDKQAYRRLTNKSIRAIQRQWRL